MALVDNVREVVSNSCEELDWKYHILPIVKYSLLLARKLNADEEVVELGALLHDIGRIKFGGKGHERTGMIEAEKILKNLHAPQNLIDEVKHIVESHRGSGSVAPRTPAARIVANADAMAHFDAIPVIFCWGLEEHDNDPEKTVRWLYDKVERDWNKKLTIPEAKELMADKYRAIKVVFDAMKEYT